MGFFDNLKNSAVNSLKQNTNAAVNNAYYNATGGNKDGVGKGKNSSQTFTFSSTFYDSRDISHYERLIITIPHDTKTWLKRGEWIVGYLWTSRGKCGKES